MGEMKAAADRCKQSEKTLIQNVLEGCDTGEEAMFIEFQVDDLNAFVAGGAVYTKEKSSSAQRLLRRSTSRSCQPTSGKTSTKLWPRRRQKCFGAKLCGGPGEVQRGDHEGPDHPNEVAAHMEATNGTGLSWRQVAS